MSKPFLRSIFTISFFTAISRIFGFIRDVLIARYLGVSLYSDVFFAAFRLPNLFRRIFAEGAFNSAFIPIFVGKNDRSKKAGEAFVKDIFSLLLYVLLLLLLAMQLAMPFLMKLIFPGFFADDVKFFLLVDLSRITIFYLLFISLVSLLSAVLNSLGKFMVPASAPIILNLTLIFTLLIAANGGSSMIYFLSWGIFIAGLLQLLWLFVFTIKSGFLIYPKMPKINADVKKFFRKILPATIGANVMQINLLIDSIFASMAVGAISYLYYADRVNQLPLALIGIAIGVALLPKLSSFIKSKNYVEAIKLQNLAIKIAILLVLPAATGLIMLSSDIITLLFKRGSFGDNEVYHVATALSFYALALPAYVMVKVLEPSFFARGNTKTPMKIAIICLLLNILLNYSFFSLSFGYVGIILASLCASYLNIFLILWRLIKQNYFHFQGFSTGNLLRLLLPTAIMALFIHLSANFIPQHSFFMGATAVLWQIIGAVIVYAILLYLWGFKSLISSFRR